MKIIGKRRIPWTQRIAFVSPARELTPKNLAKNVVVTIAGACEVMVDGVRIPSLSLDGRSDSKQTKTAPAGLSRYRASAADALKFFHLGGTWRWHRVMVPLYLPPLSSSVPNRFRISLSERGLLILLALVQFTHIMDFMIMMPLGPQLMRELGMAPSQFSILIAAYTMTAGLVGLLVAPFIDRFDRRVVLLVVYAGFIVGTLACAMSESVGGLILARAICGAFGGVATATILAIAGDVVPSARRGAAMGMIMTAFSAAAAFGVPFGLYLAQQFRWETPFYLLAVIALGVEGLLFVSLPSVRGHLHDGPPASWRNFLVLLRDDNAWRGLLLMVSLIFGHFLLIPFFSPHLVFNMHLPESYLSVVYIVGGLLTIVSAPWIGRLADRWGRNEVFAMVVGIAIGVILVFTSLGPTSVAGTLILTGLFFIFSSGRFVPAQAALASAVPSSRRGGYMSLVTCTRDFCSGLAAILAGAMVELTPGGLLHVHRLGWLAVGASLASIWLIRRVRNASEIENIPPSVNGL